LGRGADNFPYIALHLPTVSQSRRTSKQKFAVRDTQVDPSWHILLTTIGSHAVDRGKGRNELTVKISHVQRKQHSPT